MRILYTNFHTHYGGGHTTYVRSLLRNDKNIYFLACPKTSQLFQLVEKEGGATLFDVSFPSKFKSVLTIAKSIIKMARIIRQNNIGIIHTNENADNRIVIYACMLAGKPCKVILTKHNSKPIKNRITSRLRFNQFNSAVIYVSNSVVNTIGLSDIKVPVYIIENGIDTAYWQLNPTPPGPILTLVSIAGTAPCKGWQYLVQAIKRLPDDKKQRIRVKIVGKIPQQLDIDNWLDGDYCPEIVSFIGYKEEPKSELLGADIGFVLSDSQETISFACREMMSCALPVIVSDVGILPENVAHGINGWVTKRANVDSIYDTLLAILDMTPDDLMNMKQEARAKALNSFGLEAMLQKTQDVYASLHT